MVTDNFWVNKKVFITGHTGFKGSWLCQILLQKGAIIYGYSLNPPTNPSLFDILGISRQIYSKSGDIRDLELLKQSFSEFKPEIVFHLAAQPLVRFSYDNPRYTYETNVMGTVNILECLRCFDCVKSFVNITTDKVYLNREWDWGYREEDPLDGYDPYSNSKSCSDLITHSYKKSFFNEKSIAISTVRAGNVLGGGDFATDRIIPDCIRAVSKNERISLRHPNSTRPYQHVLEPLFAYLLLAKMQYKDKNYEGWYNIGPDDINCITTGELVKKFCEKWGNSASYEIVEVIGPHEANFLKLDSSKFKTVFRWKPLWNIDVTLKNIVTWSKDFLEKKDMSKIMKDQIYEYESQMKNYE